MICLRFKKVDSFHILKAKMNFVVAQIDKLVDESEDSARLAFSVSMVKKFPDDVLKRYYEQSRLRGHLSVMIASFKDLDHRVKTLKKFGDWYKEYEQLMDGDENSNGWQYSLVKGEHELRETVTYINYLDTILTYAHPDIKH
uniref:Rx_N domain-containing protein n=1 Tax=Panagrellus redivivus TaxID=6233 RepID=A0A7E4V4I9_PANRE